MILHLTIPASLVEALRFLPADHGFEQFATVGIKGFNVRCCKPSGPDSLFQVPEGVGIRLVGARELPLQSR